MYGDISKEDYEQQRDELHRQIAHHEAQQVQPPYEIDELLARLEAKKNDTGESSISGAAQQCPQGNFMALMAAGRLTRLLRLIVS